MKDLKELTNEFAKITTEPYSGNDATELKGYGEAEKCALICVNENRNIRELLGDCMEQLENALSNSKEYNKGSWNFLNNCKEYFIKTLYVNIKNETQKEIEFKEDLNNLLYKYGADIEIRGNREGAWICCTMPNGKNEKGEVNPHIEIDFEKVI